MSPLHKTPDIKAIAILILFTINVKVETVNLLYKKGLLTIALLLSISPIFSRPINKLELTIGDTVPNIILGKGLNSKKNLSINDLKGKIIIIDFWDVWCVPCIESMPKLDSLQKKFNGNIQIILVTKNTEEAVQKLFSKIKIRQPDLPIIVNDTLLSKLFPYRLVPHCVWIDKNSIVKQITNGNNTTAINIMAMLDDKKLELGRKQELKDFDRKAPLLKEGNGRLVKNVISYSLIMKRLNEFGGSQYGISKNEASKEIGIKVMNMPLIFLYKLSYSNPINNINSIEFLLNNRVLVEVKNKENFFYPEDQSKLEQWSLENVFCYESSFPILKKERLFIEMQEDLKRYFPFYAKVEKRLIKCLVLVRIKNTDLIATKGGKVESKFEEHSLTLKNHPISSLIQAINSSNANLVSPFLDDTNYSNNIDIEIKSKLNDIPQLRQELQKFGLDLQEKEKEIKMLVIEDK